MLTREDVQRQVAVRPVVTVEEAPFLAAMDLVVGRIQIENDPFRRLRVSLQESIDQEAIDRLGVVDDPLVPILSVPFRRQLQPVERALACQRLARISLLHQGCDQRIMTELVMVVEVLVAQRQCHHPLADQALHRVFHQLGVPIVAKAGCELTQQTRPPFDLSQQEPTAVRTELSAVKSGHDLTLSHPLETQLFNATLCLFHAAAPLSIKLLLTLNLIARCGGFFVLNVRNAG